MEKEHKEGNDKADEAAERGAVGIQKVTRKLADIYSWRHINYRKLMTRIQKYIIGLKEYDRQLREELAERGDPFKTKKTEKITVPRRLGYADPMAETKYLETTALHDVWFDKAEKHEEATKCIVF